MPDGDKEKTKEILTMKRKGLFFYAEFNFLIKRFCAAVPAVSFFDCSVPRFVDCWHAQ